MKALTESSKQTFPARTQLYGLDLLRFFASLMVMLFHLSFWYWAGFYKHDVSYHFLAPFTFFGFCGVEVFFTLSGFIIAYSAESTTALNFVRGRVIRLYPAAWICSTLTFTVSVAAHVHDPTSGVFNSFHATLHAYARAFLLDPLGPWIDGVYWTLGVELAFYVVVACLLTAGQFRRVGAVMTAIGCASSASWLMVTAAQHWTGLQTRFVSRFANFLLSSPKAQLCLLVHGSFFAIGVLLWLCLYRECTARRLLAIAVCAVGALLELRAHTKSLNLDRFGFPVAVPSAIWLLSIVLIFVSTKRSMEITRALGTRGAAIARTLGLMTYPLYLLHEGIGFIILEKLHSQVPDLLSLCFAVLLAMLLSFSVNRFLERPLQARLRTLLHVVRKNPLPASSLP